MADKKERKLSGPVGWLLDRQLLVNLREIVLYSAFGTRIDPRNWMVAREVDMARDFAGDEFWFDYLSDTGDSMLATYSIAYLAYSELWATSGVANGPVAFGKDEGIEFCLPRGELLLIGGDTAYHVADYETLVERFWYPFKQAFEHLARQDKVDQETRRPLFGIPGNHDYYDFLDGFNRQFRKPYNDERRYDAAAEGDQPQLVIEGFRRVQWASYFSIELPFGWRLWGMDAQDGQMDRRQRDFFRRIRKDKKKPTDKLIVATPEPITAFGRHAAPDSEIAHTLEAIGLPLPFLAAENPDTALGKDTCRLDLAGDVHHYARYWGEKPGAARPARYTSVVSGIGGAFLHSSSTDVGEVPARVRYPPPTTSLKATLRRLMEPWSIAAGGRVWVIGLLVAGLLYIVTSSAPSIKSVLRLEMEWVDLTLPKLEDTRDQVVAAISTLQTSLRVDPGSLEKPLFHVELLYLPVLFLLLGQRIYRNGRLAAKRRRGEPVPDSADSIPVWVLAAVSVLTALWVYRWHDAGYGALHPLTSNFAVLAMLAASCLGLWWSRQYDDAVNYKVRHTGRSTFLDQAQGWMLWTFTLLAGLFGVARYGYYPLGVAAIDITFLVVVLAILIGLPAFAWNVGGQLHKTPGRIGFLILGLLHALLQISVPVVLVVSQGFGFGLAAALATVAVTWLVGRAAPLLLLRKPDAEGRYLLGSLLLAAWLAWGSGLMAYAWRNQTPQEIDSWSFALALGLGAILSCTWFGWYLAISLCFDGHNNEAGGGARIDHYKQLIRFRLNRDGLTGYVIAMDKPQADGRELRPKVIDVFELRPGSVAKATVEGQP
jgi:Calcineurin-like phosphoesterase